MKRIIAFFMVIQTFFASVGMAAADVWNDFKTGVQNINFSWIEEPIKRFFTRPSDGEPTTISVSELTSEVTESDKQSETRPASTTVPAESTTKEESTTAPDVTTTVPETTTVVTHPSTTESTTVRVTTTAATTTVVTTEAPTTTKPYVTATVAPTTTVPVTTTVPATTVPTTIGNADPKTCTHSWIITSKVIVERYALWQQVNTNEICQYCGSRRIHSFGELSPDARNNVEREEAIIIQKVNALRVQNGLNTLEPAAPFFDDWCNMRAEELEVEFAHVRPNGDSCGIIHDGYHAFGENIACGYRDGESFYNGFFNSPPHKSIMLHASATHISVAIHIGSNGRTYCCMQLIRPR